jgi:uridine monophosphate synthetase
MESFFSRLERRALQADSLLCIGLDPHLADLAQPTVTAARDFCWRLIAACADLAAAFKPNAAFFERFGPPGMELLQEVIAHVPAGIPVILDAKRADIASTAEAYAQAAFQTWRADAVTVNPYLGYDSVAPFLQDPAHGVFLLCKTSNPGASDLQDLTVWLAGGAPLRLHEYVARLAQDWNQRNNLGLVVGATAPDALARLRALAPGLWFLAPGVGAQGADLAAALRAGLRTDGLGLLIPVSRAVARAADPRQVAAELREAINLQRQRLQKQPQGGSGGFANPELARLAQALLEAGMIRFGSFTLKSGIESPVYIDLRQLASLPGLLAQVAAAYIPLLQRLSFDHLAALPYAALPITTAISLASGWPMIYPRKEAKAYGTRAEIEGRFSPGERAVVIDDLTTTGGSKFEAIDKLRAAGLEVTGVVVLIDRQSGASEALAQDGIPLHAVFTLSQLVDGWEAGGQISAAQAGEVRRFLGG